MIPWDLRGFCGSPMVLPRGTVIGRPRDFHGTWLRGTSVGLPWCFGGASMGFPWELPWDFSGTYVVRLWCVHDISMGYLWDFHRTNRHGSLMWSAKKVNNVHHRRPHRILGELPGDCFRIGIWVESKKHCLTLRLYSCLRHHVDNL